MGGPGSTRWREHDRKPLVESTLYLDLLARQVLELLSQPRTSGTIRWLCPETGAPRASADFSLGSVQPHSTRLINDNYFCRSVLPQQQMLPLAS